MTAPVRVLHVEDNPDDAQLVERSLRRGGLAVHASVVDSEDALREALAAEPWELVLSDHDLPGFSGLDALRIVRELTEDLPFIFVSGTSGETVAVAAMRAGAQDYVLKQDLQRLAPAAERELREATARRLVARDLRERGRMDVGAVARDVGQLMERLVGNADIALHVAVPTAPMVVLANRSQVKHVLLALAIDARDAMPEGGKLTLEVRTTKVDDEVHAEISVSDTGSGIPVLLTKTANELATLRALVKRNGGTISLRGVIGLGSTFVLCFPLVESRRVANAVGAKPTGSTATRSGESYGVWFRRESGRRPGARW